MKTLLLKKGFVSKGDMICTKGGVKQNSTCFSWLFIKQNCKLLIVLRVLFADILDEYMPENEVGAEVK